ncbi:hypothetical protein HQ520_17285 [bacterium]|nr:hypothetical protein [bacterium]
MLTRHIHHFLRDAPPRLPVSRSWLLSLRPCVALSLLLLVFSGCALQGKPDYLEARGEGLEVPWRSPGEARRKAREAAIQDARVEIWTRLLPMRVLDEATTDSANNDLGPGAPVRTRAEEEEVLYDRITIEQLAAINPAFRAKLRRLIGSLNPEEVLEEPGGRIVIRMQVDKNEVLALAREYLRRQRGL